MSDQVNIYHFCSENILVGGRYHHTTKGHLPVSLLPQSPSLAGGLTEKLICLTGDIVTSVDLWSNQSPAFS